jgi:peptidoglycan hydrolase-like protein with peptidoglycan-binding domain
MFVGIFFKAKLKSRETTRSGKKQAMRFLILALSLLGFLVSTDAAKAGLSTTTREQSASIDPAALTDEATDGATRETEDRIGLDKRKRRDVQRRLKVLGFGIKVNGKFDDSTRAVITRWQAARGYPETGFLNALQHKALLTETVSVAHANASPSDQTDNSHPAPAGGNSARRHHRRGGGGGGPVRLIGGMIGGLFR